ncbi:MAG: hypothetical protein WD069_06390 [Planctomycetales bacterium]
METTNKQRGEEAKAGELGTRSAFRIPHSALHALLVAAIVLVPAIAYAPALNRVFTVPDTLWYLAELGGSTSLWDGLALVDYNRVSRFQQADGILFRPLFFAWAAVQTSIGGYDHRAWNVGNLAAHVIVCLCLYALLIDIQRSVFAGLAALVFSVHLANFGLVTWNQTGLLPAFALILLSILAARRLLKPDAVWTAGLVSAYLVAMTLANFAFELAVGIAALVAALVVVRFRRIGGRPLVARALLASLPFLLYTGAYGLRLWLAGDSLHFGDRSAPGAWQTVESAGRVFAEFLRRFVAFGGFNYVSIPYEVPGMGHTLSWSRPASGVSQLIAVGVVWVGWRGVSARTLRSRAFTIALVSLAMAGYALLLCLGRGYHEAASQTHYAYLFCLLATVCVYALVDWDALDPRHRRWLTALLLAAVALVGWLVADYARGVHRANAAADAYLTSVARYVERHAGEPGFSFRMAGPPSELDPPVVLIEGRQDDADAPRIHTRASEILFARYYRTENPRYLLHWTGEEIVAEEEGTK